MKKPVFIRRIALAVFSFLLSAALAAAMPLTVPPITLTQVTPSGVSITLSVGGRAYGAFNLHAGNIAVIGGMGPLDVVYNITNPSETVTTIVPTTGIGIILVPNSTVNSMDSSSFEGDRGGRKNDHADVRNEIKESLPAVMTKTGAARGQKSYENDFHILLTAEYTGDAREFANMRSLSFKITRWAIDDILCNEYSPSIGLAVA